MEEIVAGTNDSKFARWLMRHYQKKGIEAGGAAPGAGSGDEPPAPESRSRLETHESSRARAARRKIAGRKARIGVVGLGYVGPPARGRVRARRASA